jgi:hypothetical protein
MGLSHSPKVISDGLVLYLDATNTRSYSGTGSSWYDLSVYGNNSTLVSSPTFINNKYGQLAFNGSTQYATVPHTSTLWNGQTFTLSLWAKKTGTGDGNARAIMISKDTNYIDHAFNGKTMVSFMNSTGQQTLIYGNNPASYNEWRHYAFTYDGTIGVLYENGAATGSTALSVNKVSSSSSPLNIGRWNGSSFYLNGCIAGAMVYNRALNADEILQNYNATKYKYILKENIVSNGLALNYDMSDYRSAPFTGTVIYDIAGTGNTGTLVNGPTYSSLAGGILSFDGTNDYVDCNLDFGFDTTVSATLSLWLKTTNLVQRGGILGKAGSSNWEWTLSQGIDSSDIYFWYWKVDSNINLSISICNFFESNVWKKVDLVWSHTSNRLTIYRNGIGVTSSTPASSSFQNRNSSIFLGYTYNNFSSYYWDGQVGLLSIYNRALTAEEVLQNYNASKTRFGIS